MVPLDGLTTFASSRRMIEMRSRLSDRSVCTGLIPVRPRYRERILRCVTEAACDAEATRTTCAYLRDGNTIAVVVVPANITRVRDSQAMQLVQSLGKEASALGVLAKSDLAHDPRHKQRKQKVRAWGEGSLYLRSAHGGTSCACSF